MKEEPATGTNVDVKKTGAIANVNIDQFADTGFDNVDSNSLALPFLKVL